MSGHMRTFSVDGDPEILLGAVGEELRVRDLGFIYQYPETGTTKRRRGYSRVGSENNMRDVRSTVDHLHSEDFSEFSSKLCIVEPLSTHAAFFKLTH